MRPFRSGRLMMGIMLFCIAAFLFGVIMAKDVYAGGKVTVKDCAGWGENMSYTYMNEHVGDVCTEEARKKICNGKAWEVCSVEGKKDEVVGELPGEESLSDNVVTSPDEGECYANSGAVGWIICPIIEGVSNLGNWLWGEVETNFMQINAEELFQKHDGVLKAWSIFRDMANVVFVILFLVVIFSQLTGIGIDNYGIKKILPKLIVVAILINLSYLICILAVDLSNILGSGLNAMFSSIADQIPVDKYEISEGQSLVSWGLGTTGAAGGLVLFSLLSGPLGPFAIGAAVGLTVLGVVITIVISIVFLYLILVIRYAGVVLLIAIAPIAIVCYMLPNTEKLSKRWIDLLKSLLMVYPICGALVGAGKLAGNVLASTGNETLAIAGMIVSVLPFFLIPKLLKSSLALAGNIGAKLSSIGQSTGRGLSKTATGAITGSEKFKNWSQYQGERRGGIRAERLMNRLNRRAGGNIQNLSQRDQHRLLNATNAANAWRQKNAQAGVGVYELDDDLARTRAQSSRDAQEMKAFVDQYAGMAPAALMNEARSASSWLRNADGSIANGAQPRMSALLKTLESKGLDNEITSVLRNNNMSDMSSVMDTLAGSNNVVFSSYGKRASRIDNAGVVHNVSFDDYMTGAADAEMGQSMAAYAGEKSNGIVDKLDDKSLGTIANYQNDLDASGSSTQILGGEVITEALAKKNSEDELRLLRGMMFNSADGGIRSDIAPSINGAKAARYDDRTLDSLWRVGAGRQAMSRAAEEISRDPQLASGLTAHGKTLMNDAYRVTHGVRRGTGPGIIP